MSLRTVRYLSVGIGVAAVLASVAFVIWTRIVAANESRDAKSYVQATASFESRLKGDVAQLAACSSAPDCRTALSRALTDNDAYLKWATGAVVPGKLKQAHAAYIRGANLHSRGARQLLALWTNPPSSQQQFDAQLKPAADLLQQGDAASHLGDSLVVAAGFSFP